MRKIVFALLLLAGICFLTNGAVVAQAKKADPATIEIGEGKDGKFRFFVRDEDGKLLAMSQPPGGFATEKDAREAIDVFKATVAKAKVVLKKSEAVKDKAPAKDKDKKKDAK